MKRLSKFFIITLLISIAFVRNHITLSSAHKGVDPGPANGQTK